MSPNDKKFRVKSTERVSQSISFTLPISCQICLEKVKNPVVCSNQHVFCSFCIAFWADHNPHCPSCRVDITGQNSCKPLRGGHVTYNDGDSFQKQDLRKARTKCLFDEYENLIEKLETDLEILTHENKFLKNKMLSLSDQNRSDSPKKEHPSSEDISTAKILNNKLKQLNKSQDILKLELLQCKKENKEIKEESSNLSRENDRLRMDLSTRSPRRFGRTTVATLENKIETYKKEVKSLEKALESSDKLLADQENEIKRYQRTVVEKMCLNCQQKSKFANIELNNFHIINNSEDKLENNKSPNSPLKKNFYGKKVSVPSTKVHLEPKNKSSFEFEMPSPLSQSTSFNRCLSADTTNDLSTLEESQDNTDTFTVHLNSSAKKRLKFTSADASDLTDFSRPSENAGDSTISNLTESANNNSLSDLNTCSTYDHSVLIDTSSMMDESMTPELKDCMRILQEAERKVNSLH